MSTLSVSFNNRLCALHTNVGDMYNRYLASAGKKEVSAVWLCLDNWIYDSAEGNFYNNHLYVAKDAKRRVMYHYRLDRNQRVHLVDEVQIVSCFSVYMSDNKEKNQSPIWDTLTFREN